jgi:hypothetical protein
MVRLDFNGATIISNCLLIVMGSLAKIGKTQPGANTGSATCSP